MVKVCTSQNTVLEHYESAVDETTIPSRGKQMGKVESESVVKIILGKIKSSRQSSRKTIFGSATGVPLTGLSSMATANKPPAAVTTPTRGDAGFPKSYRMHYRIWSRQTSGFTNRRLARRRRQENEQPQTRKDRELEYAKHFDFWSSRFSWRLVGLVVQPHCGTLQRCILLFYVI